MRPPDSDKILEGDFFTKKKLRTLRIVTLAVALFPFVYIGVGMMLIRQRLLQGSAVVSPASNTVLLLIYLLAAVMAVLGLVMPEKKVARGSLQGMEGASGSDPPSRERFRRLMAAYFKCTILRIAIFESIGIYGLVGCVMTGDAMVLIGLNLFAFIFIILQMPGREKFLAFMDRLERG
jgi:hypothetical protein